MKTIIKKMEQIMRTTPPNKLKFLIDQLALGKNILIPYKKGAFRYLIGLF